MGVFTLRVGALAALCVSSCPLHSALPSRHLRSDRASRSSSDGAVVVIGSGGGGGGGGGGGVEGSNEVVHAARTRFDACRQAFLSSCGGAQDASCGGFFNCSESALSSSGCGEPSSGGTGGGAGEADEDIPVFGGCAIEILGNCTDTFAADANVMRGVAPFLYCAHQAAAPNERIEPNLVGPLGPLGQSSRALQHEIASARTGSATSFIQVTERKQATAAKQQALHSLSSMDLLRRLQRQQHRTGSRAHISLRHRQQQQHQGQHGRFDPMGAVGGLLAPVGALAKQVGMTVGSAASSLGSAAAGAVKAVPGVVSGAAKAAQPITSEAAKHLTGHLQGTADDFFGLGKTAEESPEMEGEPGEVDFVPFNNQFSLPDFEACVGCIFVWQRLREDSMKDPFMYVANDVDGIRAKFGMICSTTPEIFSGVCGEMATQSDLLVAKLLTNMSSVGLCGSAGYCWPELFAATVPGPHMNVGMFDRFRKAEKPSATLNIIQAKEDI